MQQAAREPQLARAVRIVGDALRRGPVPADEASPTIQRPTPVQRRSAHGISYVSGLRLSPPCLLFYCSGSKRSSGSRTWHQGQRLAGNRTGCKHQ